jgi:hypothetical protein
VARAKDENQCDKELMGEEFHRRGERRASGGIEKSTVGCVQDVWWGEGDGGQAMSFAFGPQVRVQGEAL